MQKNTAFALPPCFMQFTKFCSGFAFIKQEHHICIQCSIDQWLVKPSLLQIVECGRPIEWGRSIVLWAQIDWINRKGLKIAVLIWSRGAREWVCELRGRRGGHAMLGHTHSGPKRSFCWFRLNQSVCFHSVLNAIAEVHRAEMTYGCGVTYRVLTSWSPTLDVKKFGSCFHSTDLENDSSMEEFFSLSSSSKHWQL
jgi:hypothetical protein